MIATVSSVALPDSILGRLRLLLATVFIVGAALALAAAWLFSNAAATEAYDRLLVSAATQISEAISVEQGRFSVLPPDSAFETLAQSRDDRFFFAVRAPDGRLLTGRPLLQPGTAKLSEGVPALSYTTDGGEAMRTVTLYRFIASPGARGSSSVVVAQSLNARHRLVGSMMLRIGAIILFGAGLGYWASLEAARRALRPFDRIGRALAERRAQDTGPLEVDSPRETQALVETINAAFQRLDERLNKLQSFAGIAAHQIRTPLSALGAQTELLLTDKTAQARRSRVEKIRAHLMKLSRLTNQLLGQAMVSYRADRVTHQQIELVELLHHVLRDAIPESLNRDLAVDFEPGVTSVHVVGDSVTLREALVNLVSNAVIHGATSVIRVRLKAEGNSVSIAVADDGPGIAPDRWASALQAFQLPRPQGEGAGLGLSIAADVAKAHGGTLSFARTADGLFEITFELRAALPLKDVA